MCILSMDSYKEQQKSGQRQLKQFQRKKIGKMRMLYLLLVLLVELAHAQWGYSLLQTSPSSKIISQLDASVSKINKLLQSLSGSFWNSGSKLELVWGVLRRQKLLCKYNFDC